MGEAMIVIREPNTDSEAEIALRYVNQATKEVGSAYTIREAIHEISKGSVRLYVIEDKSKEEENSIRGAFTMRHYTQWGESISELENVGGTGIKDWIDEVVKFWEAEALRMGSNVMRARGRPGWGRYAAGFKFMKECTVWRRAVDEDDKHGR
jgi:hypothetical protein